MAPHRVPVRGGTITAVTLPFFPLGLVAFPFQPLNLHIFEPRYRQLFAELDAGGGEFAVVPVVDSRLQPFATACVLVDVAKRYPSGELDVVCEGRRVVTVESFREVETGKLYAGGEVSPVRTTLVSSNGNATERLLDRCRDLLQLLGAHRDLPSATDEGVSYSLGHWLGLKLHEELALLSMTTEDERQRHLADLVEQRIDSAGDTVELRRRAEMNGHFRYVR